MALSSYPLQALLSVRLYREDAARNGLRVAERLLVQAREDVVRCREELERYRSWRVEEEGRRYAAILGKVLSLDEIAGFRASLGALAVGEEERIQAVGRAQDAVARQETAVARARQAVAVARREAAKIETHRDIWREGDKKERERLEDLELEEFAGPPPAPDDE
ncbi:YscO family type III secretion system apparatus protein [uncultured Desulfovibrio sp.]|uniref:type III secretion system stalk subunit SctO n=1 Tax=uncultured Desulfovibrio sp. TaxID=167968 RepID=UPI002613B832|nr:YscO family type III secretion system apparatus protein [uncultured Desulfovibrio sp.]